jgi:multiple sugar transport system ATP-binding protein
MAQVQLDRVSKVYPGPVTAVREISLHIADREFVVLVGPSGCGKTTTLRMVAGLEELSGGDIRIGDRVVNDVPPKDRDVAMVFQNYALYPHMTVFGNMSFALEMRRMPKAEIRQRVTAAARTLEIEHLLDRKPKALSGGQRQRVALGRAIVREPAAFLFDEPLSNLDARLRVSTRAELKRLHQRLRTTTIYVTHDQEEAMTLGDRIVVMKDGVIQQADTPLNTYRRPANRFVAGFIGMPPMNFFNGTVVAAGDKLAFCEGRGTGGDLTLERDGFRLLLSDPVGRSLSGRIGKPLVLGVRPEHLSFGPRDIQGNGALTGTGPPGWQAIDMFVNVVEPLGGNMDVYMSTAMHDHVVGRMEADSDLQAGGARQVYVDVRKAHVFETGETGMNLSLTSEPAHVVA